jgi:hypothetical protein
MSVPLRGEVAGEPLAGVPATDRTWIPQPRSAFFGTWFALVAGPSRSRRRKRPTLIPMSPVGDVTFSPNRRYVAMIVPGFILVVPLLAALAILALVHGSAGTALAAGVAVVGFAGLILNAARCRLVIRGHDDALVVVNCYKTTVLLPTDIHRIVADTFQVAGRSGSSAHPCVIIQTTKGGAVTVQASIAQIQLDPHLVAAVRAWCTKHAVSCAV